MITSRLTVFTFAALLSSAAFAASTDGTGPTDPYKRQTPCHARPAQVEHRRHRWR